MNDSLSIFMPFFNDAGTVKRMISDAFYYGKKVTDDLEVIAVNDGSTDHTLKELKRIRKEYPSLKIIFHKRNRGYGGALRSGMAHSTKKWVFYTDGDAQYHLDELEKLWNLRAGADLVNGFKLNRSDSVIRKIVGSLYSKAIKRTFGTPLTDVDCDFRLINGDILRSLDLSCNSGAITVELVKKMYQKTDRFKEVGVNHYSREYGKSTFFTAGNIWRTIYDEFYLLKEFKT
ncbi:glycosyltransferase family 2 protein [Daejeonella lutea]|uniref:Glycosyltransferase involved in cell wall bisynthesis n=1 Tax=Daejeonella lutea TaxID=572036 RepID=A0A1T5DYF2_9SPHI|nr:glycosyltransferase family 2 protein [Daejeonella lutea]SKB76757.1 Glycosyltransferase involved in cell wall bisynthesis [Daejeonella lutea]